MKRHLRTLASVLLIAGAFACTKGLDESEAGTEVEMTIEADFAPATLAGADSVSFSHEWELGDQISLLYGTDNFVLTGKSAGASAQFTGTAVQLFSGENYIAVHPYNESYALDGRSFNVTLPKIVKLVPESFSQTIGTGIVADGKVNFLHTTAYLGFEITRDDITSIVISSSGRKLSGTFKATVNNNGTASLAPVAEETSEELLINTGAVTGKYYIPIPADKYNGFKIAFKSASGVGETFKEKFVKLAAGKVLDIGAIDTDVEWKKGETPELAVLATSSSTVGVSWSVSKFASPAADVLTDWSVGIYRDAACEDLVVSWNIPSSLFTTPEGNIYAVEGPYSPRFVFSGLEAGTEYYVKAWNTEAPEYASAPVSVKTLASENVGMPQTAAAGDIILSEDFSELVWGGDVAGRFWGYSDNNRGNAPAMNPAVGESPVGKHVINGFEHNFYLVVPTTEIGLFNTLGNAVGNTRLADWKTISEDNNNSRVCARPGYLKLGGGSKAGGIVSPALTAIKGRANIKVTFKAHPYRETANDKSMLRVMAISAKDEQINGRLITGYQTGSSVDVKISDDQQWKEYSCEMTVSENERIAIYSQRVDATTGQCRILVDDIRIEVLEVFSASKIYEIKNATDLQSFLMFSSEYTSDETVKLANDIDLEEYDLMGGADFIGTFDGCGYSLMNWTSNGVALFSSLAEDKEKQAGGKIMNLVIDESCKLTPVLGNDRFGFLAKVTLTYSCVENCVNNAHVNATIASAEKSTYYGNMIGVAYGTVKGCTNNGDINILVEGNAARMNIGGIIGYSNVQTQIASGGDAHIALNCTNNGNISYTVNGTSGHVYIGGVLSGSSPASGAITAESPSKGTVEGCVNTGNIEYTLKNGGSLTDGEGTAGSANYFNIGGVLGYIEGNVKDCVNGQEGSSKGSIRITVPTMTTGNAVSRPCAGGVVGFSLFGVDNSTNYGPLSVKGSYANAGSLQAGTGSFTGASFGGVAGLVGISGGTCSLANCKNYGTSEYDLWMNAGSGTQAPVGGVVGYSFAQVSGCSNYGAINLKSCIKMNRIGGVVGRGDGGVVNSTNNGAITASFTGAAGLAQVSMGGVMGFGSKEFNGNTNNADLTLNHPSTTEGVVYGGVVGYYSDGTTGSKTTSGLNKGKVIYNSDESNGTCWVGGYAGYSNCPDELSGIKNDGPVIFNAKGTGTTYLGGLFGNISKAPALKTLTNTANGTVTVERVAGRLLVGGISGQFEAVTNAENCTNSAALAIDADNECAAQLYLGGIIGYNDKGSTYKSCSNSGSLKVVANSTSTAFFYLSGIACASTGDRQQTFDSCSNTGDIYVNCIGKWRCGGIAAFAGTAANIKNCIVDSDITFDSTTKSYLNLGGLVGETATKQVITGNSYKGTITALKSGDQVNVGGMVGSTTTAGPVSYAGCVVDAQISSSQPSSSGMFSGRGNNNAAFVFGTETSPCKVVSGSKLNGALVEELTDAVLVGSAATYTVTKTNISVGAAE